MWDLPREEGGRLILTSNGDNALSEANPEAAVFSTMQNLRCMGLSNFRLRFVVTNDRLRVSPAADENFNHWETFVRLAGQNQMGIVWCTNSELHKTAEWEELVFEAIGSINT